MTVWKEAMGGLATSLAFLTRVPLPSFLFSDGVSTDRAVWAFPVVGALIGAALWALLSLLSGLGFFHPLVVAVAVVAAGLLLTGALHEDGLADVADGLGGGDPARRLEIMKDSRLGAFGVLALVLTVLLKAGVVFALADPLKPGLAFALLVGAAGWSRALMTAIWAALPPANPGGLASVRPDMRQAAIALTLALGLLFILLLLPGTGFL
ncbi:MAG: adenosylcobinamide-GDP ribazoletransferase, partial [Pseudomonadota bacterium]|nr:adenosylcobinamide-GDP ribazoletransferase [Pseudomonadota bacterium]